MMKRLIPVLIVAVLLAGCSEPAAYFPREEPGVVTPPAPSTPPGDKARLIRAEVPRDEAPDASAEQVQTLIQGLNSFAFDLYHRMVAGDDSNLIASPFSIALAFSMVYAGAQGETEAQMTQAFNYLPQEAQHAAFNALEQRLSELGATPTESEDGQPFELKLANAIWGQQTLPFGEAFLDTLARQYGAALRAVDFAANPDGVRESINNWVAEETNDRIDKLVPPGMIGPDTRLLLANAIYFKASWLFPFDAAATQEGPFTLLDGSQVNVPLMHRMTARVPYLQGDGYQAVQLPYGGETVDMLVILPAPGRFADVQAQLSPGFLHWVRGQAGVRDVTLTMPRFDSTTEVDLPALLKQMGMSDAFEPGAADFTGMVEGGGLYVSAALHRGTITVDEIGTEAAAATAVAMAESAMERAEVTMDRPFVYAIVARETGAVLFLGRVMNPAE